MFVTQRSQRMVANHVAFWMMVLHMGLGLSIFLGGIERFTLPTYKPLIEMTGGNIWIWGVWIMLSGAFMVSGHRLLEISGMWLGMMWMIVWSALFSVSMFQYPTSAATPAVAYAAFAAINGTLAAAKVIERGV